MKKSNRKKPVLVVCHDAGGAELVAAYVKAHQSKEHFDCYGAGPAIHIFRRRNITMHKLDTRGDLQNFLKRHTQIRYLLLSTSWSQRLDNHLIKLARAMNIKTVVFIDHWVYYRERFGYPRPTWKENLPDEIWVSDSYALDLARKAFPKKVLIRKKTNFYFKEIRSECSQQKASTNQKGNILFLSEPIKASMNSFGDENDFQFNEFEVFETLVAKLAKNHFDKSLTVRLHPAEKKTKYDRYIKKFQHLLHIKKSRNSNIISDLAQSELVVGIDTVALVIALLCRKKVISYFPDPVHHGTLPHTGIINLSKKHELDSALRSFIFV